MKRILNFAVLGLAATMTACGPSTSHNQGAPTGVYGQGQNGGATDSNGTASNPSKGKTTTTSYDLALYDPGTPCSGISGNYVAMAQVPDGCFRLWLPFNVGTVPGPGLLHQNPPWYPASVQALSPVTTVEAQQWANAYVRDQTFARYADQTGSYQLLRTVTAAHSSDKEAALVQQGAHIVFPDCFRATALRAVRLDGAAQAYASSTSTTALVVTFAGCSQGLLALWNSGHNPEAIPLNPKQSNILVTGSVETIDPFGKLWIIESEVPCGNSALNSVCP